MAKNYIEGQPCPICETPMVKSRTSGYIYCKACYKKKDKQQQETKHMKESNNNKSFSLSYAKDITVALITNGFLKDPKKIGSYTKGLAQELIEFLEENNNEFKSPIDDVPDGAFGD